MNFAAPERLWLVPAVCAALWLPLLFARRRRPAAWVVASALLRSALVTLTIAWWAGPVVVETRARGAATDLIVDESASVDAAARDLFIARARTAAAAEHVALRTTGFSARTRDLLPATVERAAAVPEPGVASRATAGDAHASDPRAALARAVLAPAGGAPARVVMWTDGAVVAPDAGWVAAAPRVTGAWGADATIVRAATRPASDVHVTRVGPTAAPVEGEPLTVAVTGRTSHALEAVAHVAVDGGERRELPVALPAGAFTTTVPAGELSAGRHLLSVWFAGGAPDSADAEAAVIVDVPARPQVLVVAPDGDPLIGRALRAQEIAVDVVGVDALVSGPALAERESVIVLDRVDVAVLSTPRVLDALTRAVRRGGGLWYLPRDDAGELVPGAGRGFLSLLPFVGRPLPPAPPPEKPPEPPPEDPALQDADPAKRRTEHREAPSLGMLLVIDASGSMQGQKLRLAKEAAIAAAEVLHPDDRIGVIAFNREPVEVLPMTRAGDRAAVKDRVSRIQATGGTVFGPALDMVRDVFSVEKLQIKHCIFLSDGDSEPGRVLERVDQLVEAGITLSTVGVGPDADAQFLTDMAVHGRGKYQPAYTADEIPQIFTVEAERVITATGARKHEIVPPGVKPPPPPPPPKKPPTPPVVPKPDPAADTPVEPAVRTATPVRVAWPAAYLKGTKPENTPGILGWHAANATPSAWISLRTGTPPEDPVLGHTFLGFGRIVASTVSFQSPNTGPLAAWEDYGNLCAQIVRFLSPPGPPARLHVELAIAGRALEVTARDLDGRATPAEHWLLTARDQRGRALDLVFEPAGPFRWRALVPPWCPVSFVDVTVAGREASLKGSAAGAVAPPPELAGGSADDPPALLAWSERLGARIDDDLPARLAASPTVDTRQVAFTPWWTWLLVPLWAMDLLLKRLRPGTVR